MPNRSSSEKDVNGEKAAQDHGEPVKLHEALFNLSESAILYVKTDGHISKFNRCAEQLLGYDAGEVIGKTLLIFLDTDQVEKRAAERMKSTGKQIASDFEVVVEKARETKVDIAQWTFVRKDGSQFNGELTVICVRDQRANIVGYVAIIAESLRAESDLYLMAAPEIAKQNLRFFNNPVNLNAVVDFDGNLLRISPSWTKILGWTEEELTSQPIFRFIYPDDLQRAKEHLVFLSRSTNVHTFEHRLMCKDGTYRWMLWGLAPDLQSNTIYATAIDITDRKKSEENILDSKSNLESITLQLQEQNRRLDEFAHIISHNLRAPVNNIQALINLLNENSEITDYKLIFEKLKNVAKNLSETMNELMDTLKVKTQEHVSLTEIRFKEVLDKVVQSLEGELIVAQASVTFDFNEAPVIRYSKPYLESIFQNLLTNAVKYKSPDRKPAIHFRSFMKDNRLILQVKDNGRGIDLKKFGDKLFGLHKTFHDHQEARGVGLFLVRTQIEAMGGSISAESEVDKGTTFTIRFN